MSVYHFSHRPRDCAQQTYLKSLSDCTAAQGDIVKGGGGGGGGAALQVAKCKCLHAEFGELRKTRANAFMGHLVLTWASHAGIQDKVAQLLILRNT